MHTKENALYIKQVAGLRPMSQLERFVLTTDSANTATKRNIQLGDLSKGKLIIESGITADEQFISQMPDTWSAYQTINIDQQG